MTKKIVEIKDKIKYHNNDYYYDIVRRNIKIYRKLLGYTQDELGEKIGVYKQYISQIERKNYTKNITIGIIGKIADVLNIDIKCFFENSNNGNEFLEIPEKNKQKKLYDEDYYYDIIRYNIKRYRIIKGYTQEQLAELVDNSIYYICQIETGNPKKYFTLEFLGRIADALEIDIKNFFEKPKNASK